MTQPASRPVAQSLHRVVSLRHSVQAPVNRLVVQLLLHFLRVVVNLRRQANPLQSAHRLLSLLPAVRVRQLARARLYLLRRQRASQSPRRPASHLRRVRHHPFHLRVVSRQVPVNLRL